jgi:hypothetical protein
MFFRRAGKREIKAYFFKYDALNMEKKHNFGNITRDIEGTSSIAL